MIGGDVPVSYPFDRPEFIASYSGKELYDICLKIKKSDILKKLGLPKEFHNTILSTMCMFYSIADFNYKEKLEGTFNGFEQLLRKSDIVKNKDYPFIDFESYIKGYRIVKISEK